MNIAPCTIAPSQPHRRYVYEAVAPSQVHHRSIVWRALAPSSPHRRKVPRGPSSGAPVKGVGDGASGRVMDLMPLGLQDHGC